MLNNLPDKIDPEFLQKILSDKRVMIEVARQNFLYFFYIFLGSYIKYPIAPFHRDMFNLAQDDAIKRAGVIAFRDSAKSTILNTAYALWAIIGIQQKKHVVIVSQTQQRARDHLKNIRREIERNELLRKYLGPFEENEDQWNISNLVIPRYGARISAISAEESIRGLREGPHRPDLIIADDIEDSNSVKTKEGRDKIFNWLTGELLPIGNINTKAVFIGNLLHEDSALMRIEKMISEKNMDGVFLKVPLFDDRNNIAWPGKFPSLEAVENFRRGIGNDILWQREYLLRIASGADKLVHREKIHYYKELPETFLLYTATGADLAISQKDTADFTAMVSARVHRDVDGVKIKIYILPNPVNERLNFLQTVDRIKLIQKALTLNCRSFIYIESVGYQEALVEQLKREGCYYVEGVQLHGQDKHARLAIANMMIESGQILFPEKGAEALIEQLLGFGMERHDDLVDAFTLLILKIMSWKHVVLLGGF